MKKILILLLISYSASYAKLVSKPNTAETKSEYKIDNNKIDDLFNNAEDISLTANSVNYNITKTNEEEKQLIAGIIAIGSLVLGPGFLIPIHRIVLGTGGETAKIIALYCITLSGCGFITLVDGILLLSNAGGTEYVENSSFIMW
ncbi:MAG: hypothetical protein V4667_08025 [Bacteroidota bacterium]